MTKLNKKKEPFRKSNKKLDSKQKTVLEKSTVFESMLYSICRPSKLAHFVIASFAVTLGFILNAFDEMPLFWIKAIFGFSLYIILIFSIKYLKIKNQKIKFELTGDSKLAKCQMKYTKRANSNSNYILCFLACIFFVTISIVLNFVQINLIGTYSLMALFGVVFVAFIVFQQYINILLLLYDISKIDPDKFYELLPERTEWFNLLETVSDVYRNIFIVLGSLFILLFILFSPVNSMEIIFFQKFMSTQYILLVTTWIIIIIAIVFMIPFSSLIRYNLLYKIYSNLSARSFAKYDDLYKVSKTETRLIYMDIILRISDRKYILHNSYAWVIPTFMSITNVASVILSAIADLKGIGLLT